MKRVLLITSIAAGLLAGCAVGPTYQAPAVAPAAAWHAVLAHGGAAGSLAQWWAQFDDPLLGELIATAQRDSPSLAQALARIEQSRAGVAAARATAWPGVNAGAGASRSGSAASPAQTTSQAALTALWELDLFGANRRAREAAAARLEGAQAQWHDARVSLAAEVALAYVNLRACEALADAAQADLASRRESDRLTQLKAKAGFDAPADAALTAASVADAAARLSAQRADCDITVKSLVALTGSAEPALRARLSAKAATLPAPAALGVDQVPANVLSQRPDLAAAERALAAASAEIGGAEAARYPSVSLTGSIGWQSLRLGGASTSGRSWSFGPSLDLPLFDAGARTANVQAARARYDEALAAYRGRARDAVREVEESLVRLASASEREADAQRAADGYAVVLKAATDRWRLGAGSLLDLEETRRVAVNARSQLINVQRERVSAWIGLYRAVGGGWSAGAPVETAAAR
jgi:outer membrane protein, multidrug efflux system